MGRQPIYPADGRRLCDLFGFDFVGQLADFLDVDGDKDPVWVTSGFTAYNSLAEARCGGRVVLVQVSIPILETPDCHPHADDPPPCAI